MRTLPSPPDVLVLDVAEKKWHVDAWVKVVVREAARGKAGGDGATGLARVTLTQVPTHAHTHVAPDCFISKTLFSSGTPASAASADAWWSTQMKDAASAIMRCVSSAGNA